MAAARLTEGPRARGYPVPQGRGIARKEGFGQSGRKLRERAVHHAFAKISDALCPPKPIELDSAVVMARARAVLGT